MIFTISTTLEDSENEFQVGAKPKFMEISSVIVNRPDTGHCYASDSRPSNAGFQVPPD
jgi:hypothetical protein